MGIVDEWRDLLRRRSERREMRRRMEEIDRQSSDLIEAGYYDEAEDLMEERGSLFEEYCSNRRRSFVQLIRLGRREGRA